MSKTIRIAMVGLGTVGGGVVSLLREHSSRLRETCGCNFEICHVLVRNKAKAIASGQVDESCLYEDGDAFIADALHVEEVDVLIEVGGGVELMLPFVRSALSRGIPVITANKALLAAHGPELFGLARANGVSIGFEASCAGGIPVVNGLLQPFAASRVTKLYGILNGTTNYILTRMASAGLDYASALKEAQELGYAEADPTLDINGQDACQKLCILGSLAMGVWVDHTKVPCEGIDRLEPVDFAYGSEMGYAIKLLATMERWPDSDWVCAQVRPCFVPKADLLSRVEGPMNALEVYGDPCGAMLLHGAGAGSGPTAHSVVADLVGLATRLNQAAFNNLKRFPDQAEKAPVISTNDTESEFYLRLRANDRPGVLSEVIQILGQHHISVSGVLQHYASPGEQHVPLVITTHKICQGVLEDATAEIVELAAIDGEPVILRIVH